MRRYQEGLFEVFLPSRLFRGTIEALVNIAFRLCQSPELAEVVAKGQTKKALNFQQILQFDPLYGCNCKHLVVLKPVNFKMTSALEDLHETLVLGEIPPSIQPIRHPSPVKPIN